MRDAYRGGGVNADSVRGGRAHAVRGSACLLCEAYGVAVGGVAALNHRGISAKGVGSAIAGVIINGFVGGQGHDGTSVVNGGVVGKVRSIDIGKEILRVHNCGGRAWQYANERDQVEGREREGRAARAHRNAAGNQTKMGSAGTLINPTPPSALLLGRRARKGHPDLYSLIAPVQGSQECQAAEKRTRVSLRLQEALS